LVALAKRSGDEQRGSAHRIRHFARLGRPFGRRFTGMPAFHPQFAFDRRSASD
jgi:hypothetical protein